MNEVKLYHNHNVQQIIDSTYFLNKYIHLIKWNPNGGDVAMDIGCGPGKLTTTVLLTFLPNDLKKLVAFDISKEMIDFAEANNPHPLVEYCVADISSKQLKLDWYGSFDHLFSFFCLHWAEDQKQAFQNMYDLLKPGGDMLVILVANCAIYNAYEVLKESEKWGKYFRESRDYMTIHRKWSKLENVQKCLDEVGFNTEVCEIVDRNHVHDSLNILKQSMRSINPYMNAVPEDLRKEFMDEVINEMKPYLCRKEEDASFATETVVSPIKIIAVVATKSKN